MTVTSIPNDAPAYMHWPTPEERSEAMAVGMSSYNLAQMLLAPTAEATFYARYALRWGARPDDVARALAQVAGRAS